MNVLHEAMVDTPELLLWGAPELRAGGSVVFAPERRFQLLAMLALKSGEWVPRDQIAALLWPDHGNVQARRNLRNVVFKAHAVPGGHAIQANDHALRWDVATDLQAFDRACQEQRFGDAVDLRRGALLEGLDDIRNDALASWLSAERGRLDARWHQAALDHLALLADPDARAAIAERLLRADPLDETAVAALIGTELQCGRTAQARRIYRDFAMRLADELGVEPSHRLRDLLEAAVPALPAAAAPAVASEAVTPAKSFVGRKSELAELDTLLTSTDGRQVTILGPGGVGKSSLARQAAAKGSTAYPGGAVWVELQDLVDNAAVAARLARLLDVTLVESRDAVEQLASALSSQRTLIVFDNAEHLADLPAFVDRLLAAAPSLGVIATSRARLRGPQERVLLLAGLAVPDDDSRDLEAASTYDSVRLFEARAAAAQRGFDLARHLDAVIDCVDAVAGLPLAIELTASWVRLLPPKEIARELRSSIDLLERDPAQPDAPARPEHRSLGAVIEQSWQLLSPRERAAVTALSVFQGGFTRVAAQRVGDVSLPLLSALIDKSLLLVGEGGRFSMHPVIATDARRRLDAEPERAAEMEARHADYFAKLQAGLAPYARTDHRPLVAALDTELANCRAAWRHAVAHRHSELIGQAVTSWRTYFDMLGRFSEGVAELRPALELPPRDPAAQGAQAQVRSALSWLLYRKGDFQSGLSVAAAGVDLAERCADRRALVGCLLSLGSCHSALGHWAPARPIFARALALAQEDGDRNAMAAALTNLGITAKREGSFDDALTFYSQALAIEREEAHHETVARLLNNIGNVHLERHDWAAAKRVKEQGLRHCEEFSIGSTVPHLALGVGVACFELGALEQAERHLQRALESSRINEVLPVELPAQCQLARLAARRGDIAQALDRLCTVARTARGRDWTIDLLDVAHYFGECLRDSGRHVDAARTWQMVADHAMSEAGLRDSAVLAREALSLTTDERAEVARLPSSLDAVIDRLLAIGDAAGPTAGKR